MIFHEVGMSLGRMEEESHQESWRVKGDSSSILACLHL